MVRAVMIFGVLLAAPGMAWAQQQCTTNANQVVTRIYQQILERAPDANAAGRVRQLANGSTTVRQMVADVAKSAEHAQRFFQPTETQEQKESAVNFAYRHLLARPGDAGGIRAYVTKAQQLGFNAVVDELVSSAEYMNKYGNDGVPGTGIRWCGTDTTVATSGVTSDQAGRARMRFRGMDRNADGQIARNEWRANGNSFRVHDRDGNSVLAGEEVAVGGAGGNTRNRTRARSIDMNAWTEEDFLDLDGGNETTVRGGFATVDSNSDGRIQFPEWPWSRRAFTTYDSNGDGVISRQEFRAGAATSVR